MAKQAKMPADPNRRAKATVDAIDAILDAWPEPITHEKDPERVARGKVSGAKGGKVRASKLSPERRSEIARKAAAVRWASRS
jgi:hypothetical protein